MMGLDAMILVFWMLSFLIPLNEEVVVLVGYHKLFHDLDYLPVTFFGSASPQLQAYSSGGNWLGITNCVTDYISILNFAAKKTDS